jgi:zinc protease
MKKRPPNPLKGEFSFIKNFCFPPLGGIKGGLYFLFFLLVFSNAFAFEKTTLPNQTKLIFKPESSHQIVALQCFIPGLLTQERVTQSGLAQLTLEALLKGSKNKTEKEIFNALEPFGSKLDVSLARDFGLITLISTKDQFEKDLTLFLEILKQPAFNAGEIQKLKITLLQNQKSRLEDPFTVAMDQLQKELYPRHPYGKMILGETKTNEPGTRSGLCRFHFLSNLNRSFVRRLFRFPARKSHG